MLTNLLFYVIKRHFDYYYLSVFFILYIAFVGDVSLLKLGVTSVALFSLGERSEHKFGRSCSFRVQKTKRTRNAYL